MKVAINIDASELNAKIQTLQALMNQKAFENRIAGIFRRSGGHIRKIVKNDVPMKYYAKKSEIGKAVKNPKVSVGGMGVGCTIPIIDTRKKWGSGKTQTFKAYGGANGWAIPPGGYRITADIIKGQTSTAPYRMSTGQRPFRNLSAPRLNNIAFYRVGKEKKPIKPVTGIGIPQMPMNRSEPEVSVDVNKYIENRIDHEIERILSQL